MYNVSNYDSSKFVDLPNVKEATTINLTEYNITHLELLFWLDNNTKVKHILKYTGENDYHVFFKNENEYKKISEFLETKFIKTA